MTEKKRGRYVSEGVFVTEGGMDEMFEHYKQCCEEGKTPPLYVSRYMYNILSKAMEVEETDSDPPLFVPDLGGQS